MKGPAPRIIPLRRVGDFWFGSLGRTSTDVGIPHVGYLARPPRQATDHLLQGASPTAAVVFPIFEFILYWCITVSVTLLVRRLAAPECSQSLPNR